MRTRNTIIIIQAILLMVAIYLLNGRGRHKPKEDYNYQTQHRIELEYKPLELKGFSIKPAIITEYVEVPGFDNNQLVCHEDSLLEVIDRLRNDTVRIKPEFLTKFPKSPKLVDLSLTYDSVDIRLLGINAELINKSYPLDFKHYTYQISTTDEFRFNAVPINRRKTLHDKPYRVGVFMGYDPASSYPITGGQVDYNVGKWVFTGRPRLSLSETVGFQLDLTAGYILF